MKENFDLLEHRKELKLGLFHTFATNIANIDMISHTLALEAYEERAHDVYNECIEIQNICKKLHEIIRKDLPCQKQ